MTHRLPKNLGGLRWQTEKKGAAWGVSPCSANDISLTPPVYGGAWGYLRLRRRCHWLIGTIAASLMSCSRVRAATCVLHIMFRIRVTGRVTG